MKFTFELRGCEAVEAHRENVFFNEEKRYHFLTCLIIYFLFPIWLFLFPSMSVFIIWCLNKVVFCELDCDLIYLVWCERLYALLFLFLIRSNFLWFLCLQDFMLDLIATCFYRFGNTIHAKTRKDSKNQSCMWQHRFFLR